MEIDRQCFVVDLWMWFADACEDSWHYGFLLNTRIFQPKNRLPLTGGSHLAID